jgi:transposase
VPRVLFNICVCERKLFDFFLCRVLSFIFYLFGMVRRKLTIPERWQAVGRHSGGFNHRRVADHFRVNHSIIVRLMQRFRQTGNVTDRPRAGRPRKTTPREDRLISRRARQRPFSTAGALRGNLAFGGHISTRTVIRWPPPSGNASTTTHETSTVDITSLPCSI